MTAAIEPTGGDAPRLSTEPQTAPDDGCPDDPCILMPARILWVALGWTIVLIAVLVLYERDAGFATFVRFKLGQLPFEAIWFGAVGGLLISLQGIFDHNHKWRARYDYWHMLRPVCPGPGSPDTLVNKWIMPRVPG